MSVFMVSVRRPRFGIGPSESALIFNFRSDVPPMELCRCCRGHFQLWKLEFDSFACDKSGFGFIICLRKVPTLLQKP